MVLFSNNCWALTACAQQLFENNIHRLL